MSTSVYGPDGELLEQWDDASRTYTDFRPDPDESRPYTDTENATADAQAQAATHAANEASLEDDLDEALISLQVIIDDLNANINDNPAARIKDVAKALKKTIRKVNQRFEDTE